MTQRTPVFGGCEIVKAPNNALSIKVTKSQTDLSRFKSLSYSNRHLYLRESNQVFKIDQMCEEPITAEILAKSTSPKGEWSVRFRKGDKNEKDVYVEVWSCTGSQAMRSSLKVTDKMPKIYNDSVFGGISWSEDESKICFIGEKPEPASYKNYWD